MARSGYRIFDADTHIIEAAEPIEAYLSAADRAKLNALGPLVGRAAGKGGMSRYRVGKRPDLNRMLGSRDRVPPADAVTRGLKDGGTPWDPIWAAAQEHDLTVVIHSFTMSVPYPPGMWDNWDNMFLVRSASHVWNAQRNMAALIGSGVLDRFPSLRLTSLECGHGWLAFWASCLDEQAEMSQHALPRLKKKPSEYIRGPQYFQSIQLHEGELSLRQAIEAIGEDTLMFATDYPHSESWFPKSVDAVLKWTSIPEGARRKLLWENAVRCYRRYIGYTSAIVEPAATAAR